MSWARSPVPFALDILREVPLRTRYVWLICGCAILVVEVLTGLALRGGFVSPDALHSLAYTLYLVAGIGAGRLEASGRVGRAMLAGCLAGAFTGLVGSAVSHAMKWILGLWSTHPVMEFLVLSGVTVLTAATLGFLGGIAGWGVRRAVEPA